MIWEEQCGCRYKIFPGPARPQLHTSKDTDSVEHTSELAACLQATLLADEPESVNFFATKHS